MARITPLLAKKELYSDLFKDLTQNPVSNDLARKTNEDAVKEAINNLLLTDRGERPFQPLLGCDIRKMLFENLTESTTNLMEEVIRTTLRNYEPRANIISVRVSANEDRNEVYITITFNVINSEDEIVFNKTLTRIR